MSECDVQKIPSVKIGIAGAGGLGSNCAMNLVRLGFKDFILVDFDVVNRSNLNRQFFFEDQIGQKKVDALKENLLRIKDSVRIKAIDRELSDENIADTFSGCSVVVEAFDSSFAKKMLIESLSGGTPFIVTASGLGADGSTDSIKTRTISSSLVLVGDGENDIDKGVIPRSPGVNVAAAKQAGAVFNHILNKGKRRPFCMPDLYGLTYSECSAGRTNIEIVKEMIKAGIKLIQYREKDKSMAEKYIECLEIRKLTRESDVFFIINDHIELAMMVGADGIHIGQDDIPLQAVRQLVGEDMIIGLSTHSPEQGRSAVLAGADYIGVGPIFATKTKKNVCDPVGFEYLEWVVGNLDIPFVAIGGIKKHNLAEIVKRGASTVALVSEITGEKDIPALVGELKQIIEDSKR